MKLFSFLNILRRRRKKNIPITFFNTLSGKKEVFTPIREKQVKMYNCGPTVYDLPHIGNFRSLVFADILRRTLENSGYAVQQVINITDVGHLTSDADEGEDKVEKKARQEKRRVEDVVKQATDAFFDGLKKLNIKTEHTKFPKASEHINELIAFIETLEQHAYTYKTSDGIYFDTSRFPSYGKLGNIDIEGLKEGARVEENKEKKHLTDFALWKFSPEGERRQQEWNSPWGVGFPGWHIECSAMALAHLGKQLDIHTGGIDHIPIHHNNEIAQTESLTGKQFVKYWMHNAFITVDGQKISKSLGNTITIQNLIDKKIPPLAFRYFLLSAHYRTSINFTWMALEGARTATLKLHRYFMEETGKTIGIPEKKYTEQFNSFINDDLNTPKAIALLWELIKDKYMPNDVKRATLLSFDKILGLGLIESVKGEIDLVAESEKTIPIEELPKKMLKLVDFREEARKNKDWEKADKLRRKMEESGFSIEDTEDGPVINKLW